MKKHIIINVGRQLGSGGRIIGNRIAEDFNIKFYDCLLYTSPSPRDA